MSLIPGLHALALALALGATAFAGEPSETLTVPTFGTVALYAPLACPTESCSSSPATGDGTSALSRPS